jgi:hypothetical protein
LSIKIVNGELTIDFYRKKARINTFINAETTMHISKIIAIVANERQRILKRCEQSSDKVTEESKFIHCLKLNGFNDQLIQKIRHREKEMY